MSANATGTPTTNFSIPKFNTSADAPNGTGVNEMMDAIDSLLAGTLKFNVSFLAQSGATTNQILAWSGTAWAPASGTALPITNTGDMIYSSSGSTAARLAIGGTGAILNVSGGIPAWLAVGTIGQSLRNNGTSPGWKTLATVNATPSNPTPPTTTGSAVTAVQLGLGSGWTLTPASTGKVHVSITGALDANWTNTTGLFQISYGTGSAPVNGAAATGTTIGGIISLRNALGSFSQQAVITGLTVGTAYWFDIQQGFSVSQSGQSAGIVNLTASGIEVG